MVENNNDIVDSQENEVSENQDDKKRFSRREILAISGVGLLTVALAGGSAYVVTPMVHKHEAVEQLNELDANSGSLVSVNTVTYDFTKNDSLSGISDTQKALGDSSGASTQGQFVFSNDKNNDKIRVELFLDFDSQGSRDFILMNQTVLHDLLTSGNIELVIYPVVSSSSYSFYAPEVLAEVFSKDSANSWNALISLMKLSSELSSKNVTSQDDVMKSINTLITNKGIQNVSEDSIKNGYFASWIITSADDSRLKTGYYPPIFIVNGETIDPNSVHFNNSSEVKNVILSKK